ncbi:armadillo-type protein [Mycena latifolia]|nr:armadillo-type protein [Mycena latifolia]
MPPPRVDTPQSIHSWWSDSNPPGATIQLHSFAKILEGFMHHRKALRFLSEWEESPLTQDRVDILISYLGWKGVQLSTKIAILQNLILRARSRQNDANILGKRDSSKTFLYLLQSAQSEILGSTCALLAELLVQKATADALSEFAPWDDFIRLSKHPQLEVQKPALRALTLAVYWTEQGARAAIDANVLAQAVLLLDSERPELLSLAYSLLCNIAIHPSLLPRVVNLGQCGRIISLLSNATTAIHRGALSLLLRLSRCSEGVHEILEANGLSHLLRFLHHHYSAADLQILVFRTLGNILAFREFHASVVDINFCSRLVNLVTYHKPRRLVQDSKFSRRYGFPGRLSDVVVNALDILCRISSLSEETAYILVKAKIVPCTVDFLHSTDDRAVRSVCRILGNIAKHQQFHSKISQLDLFMPLASNLGHSHIDNQTGILDLLGDILEPYRPGAIPKELVPPSEELLPTVVELADSPNSYIVLQSCRILHHLAKHKSMHEALLRVNPCPGLVPLLRDANHVIQYHALYTLVGMSHWDPAGARAAVNADVLCNIGELLASSRLSTLQLTCWMLGNIARSPSLNGAVVERTRERNLFERLESLAQHEHPGVRAQAIYALDCISQGAELLQIIQNSSSAPHQWLENNINPAGTTI